MEFEKSKTRENLARTFAGECQDGARYQFISQELSKQGFTFLSDTVKILAKNEMAHAKAIYDLIVMYSNGQEYNIPIQAGFPFNTYDIPASIERSIEIEEMEAKNIYTAFAKIAQDEGFVEASELLTLITKVENCHSKLLTEVYERFKNNTLYKKEQATKWKCGQCGHEETAKQAWQICPLCKKEQGYVMIDFADE